MSSQASGTESKYRKIYRSIREAETEDEKVQEQKILEISKKILDKCQTNQSTMYDINRDIFGWSLARTDFEYFSDFFPLLKQSNMFLDSVSQRNQACTEHFLRFKGLLWSLFSGFGQKSSENSSDTFTHMLEYQHQHGEKLIKYYKSILENAEQNYRKGTFVERFKILSRITKVCPVRLDLMDLLHRSMACNEQENVSSDTRRYRLFATIISDRHFNKYCRLRIAAVNAEFDTSRLTRSYDEETFLRVTLVQTSENPDMVWRFAPHDHSDVNDTSIWDTELGNNSVIHNVSILLHMMRDLCKTTDQSPETVAKVERELQQENINRMNKGLSKKLTAQWSTSDFDPLEEYAFRKSNIPSIADNESSSSYFDPVDLGSLKIAGRCFKYLTTTSCGVHKNMHIFSVKEHQSLLREIFTNEFLDKNRDYELKVSLRMGLWFTPSISMNLGKEVKIEQREDIGKHTDGCGCVSLSLAREMSARWKEGRKYKNVPFVAQNVGPTEWNAGVLHDSEIEYADDKSSESQPEYYCAFQVRLDGLKGMLLVDRCLGEEKCIQYTPSQEKFVSPEINGKSRYATIEIVQCSQPMSAARLNFAIISLIVACAKDPDAMQEYLTRLALKEIKNLLENRAFAIRFALKHNDVKSFNMLGAGGSLLETFLAGYYQNYARRFKIVVDKSRRLFGVADFWNVLKEGEVFVKISNLGTEASTGPGVKEQRILVTKEPCFHRGDLRRYIAVTEQALWQRENGTFLADLQDVIVFSCCREKRSEPDKICGSDLDGDQYFVCWDEVIVQSLSDHSFDPGEFEAVKKERIDSLYKKCVKNAAEKESNKWKKQNRLNERNPESSSSEDASSSDSLSSEEKALIRDHKDDSEFLNDMENEMNKLSEDVESTSRRGSVDIEQLRYNASRKAMFISQSSIHFSIHDVFDIHMRIIDNWKHEWVSEKNWQLMEKFCQKISLILDAPKSDVMTFKKPLVRFLSGFFDQLPKYPHFHPSKRKDECKRSGSALGGIYDSLRKQLDRDLKSTLTTETATPSNSETCPNTLYDEISEMKLNFLFYHATFQSGSEAEATPTTTVPSHFSSTSDDVAFNLAVPHISIEKISEWYQREIFLSTRTNLVKKEAACTMLWKLIMFLNLKSHLDSNLHIIYLRDGESLSDINCEDIVSKDFSFCCIREHLFDELKSISTEPFFIPEIASKKLFQLTQDQATALIERLGTLVARTFWKDMKLPYPDSQRRARLLSTETELKAITFAKIRTLFDIHTREALRKPFLTGVKETRSKVCHRRYCDKRLSAVVIGNSGKPPESILSELRDIVSCLFCFPETWSTLSSKECLSDICTKLAEVSFHYIQLYKYTKVIFDDRINLELFPRCDSDELRIDLSKLEMADEQMQELFELLFS